MSKQTRITRRHALKMTAGAVGAAAMPLVHMRTAGAAGKLSMGVWDHWVKATNPVLRNLVEQWGEKNKVEIQLDFITSSGGKIYLTQAAESQARTGHDVLAFDQWNTHHYSDKLVDVSDVVNGLIKQYGPVSKATEYLGIVDGAWKGVPVAWGSAPLPCCARISMLKQFANVDVTAWYPASDTKGPGADEWTYEKQLEIAKACFEAGHPLSLGCGSESTDANQTWGATFGAFGAHLVDKDGNITADSDPVREVLDYVGRLVPYLPPETISYDDASNNRALISGSAAMIWNPPSAYAVAKRDKPEIAADCWTFPNPKGKMGRLVPHRPYFWGIWEWAQNQSAAKDLMAFLMQRENVEAMSVPASGYDIPPFVSMSDFPIWAEVAPPAGTIYNYPLRPQHEAEHYIVASSAPVEIAVQIWSRYLMPSMVARMVQGQKPKAVIDWVSEELEGLRRG
ncbi:MAG: extracellular solute-binding protein [Gammaproteobacteria bacterium]|nr:extracellular solute-binding protein [Gammaproteobacteria bacterium]